MKRDNSVWCRQIGICVYPGGEEALVVRCEDGTIGFIRILTYKGETK